MRAFATRSRPVRPLEEGILMGRADLPPSRARRGFGSLLFSSTPLFCDLARGLRRRSSKPGLIRSARSIRACACTFKVLRDSCPSAVRTSSRHPSPRLAWWPVHHLMSDGRHCHPALTLPSAVPTRETAQARLIFRHDVGGIRWYCQYLWL